VDILLCVMLPAMNFQLIRRGEADGQTDDWKRASYRRPAKNRRARSGAAGKAPRSSVFPRKRCRSSALRCLDRSGSGRFLTSV